MPKEWFQRLYLVLAVVLGSLYLLIPTFFWHPKEETAAKLAATPAAISTPGIQATGTSAGQIALTPAVTGTGGAIASGVPGWMGPFPKKRLRLGLDLVGGTHLALGVDTEEALRAIIGGERRDARERLTKEGIAFESVSQPFGAAELQITLKHPGDRDELKRVLGKVDHRLEEIGWSQKDDKAVASYG